MLIQNIYVWCEFFLTKISSFDTNRIEVLQKKNCTIEMFLIKTSKEHIYGQWAEYQNVKNFEGYLL